MSCGTWISDPHVSSLHARGAHRHEPASGPRNSVPNQQIARPLGIRIREEDRVRAVRRVGGSPATSARRLYEFRARMTLTSGAVQSRPASDNLDTDSHPVSNDEDDTESARDAVIAPFTSQPRWKRVLLKVSGEALSGDGTSNIDPKVTMAIAHEVAAITRLGVEVAIVVGGGNFFRGSAWAGASGLDRSSADQIGMIATVMNAIFLQASLESIGVSTRVQTAYRMSEVAEPYIRRRAIRHLEKGRVVIFGAGTGNPFFTTDSAAALRAAEIGAEVVLKGTNVDGVYDRDPKKHPEAKLLRHLTHRHVALNDLKVMDITAITLCLENNIPVVVFNLNESGNIKRALMGEQIGTLIDNEEKGHS